MLLVQPKALITKEENSGGMTQTHQREKVETFESVPAGNFGTRRPYCLWGHSHGLHRRDRGGQTALVFTDRQILQQEG